jgi:hypothetical protein
VSERNVRRLLDAVPVDRDAEERAWAIVRSAYAERTPVRRRSRAPLRVAIVLAVLVAAVLSPAGSAVVDAVRRTLGVEHAAPALFKLPAPGRVLVSGAGGTWVVAADGSKRRLGDYTQAAWSPHGLYVVGATRDGVAAIEPDDGEVHWSLARPAVAFPRWGGSRVDTRVAYLSQGRLRMVGGNGRGDRAVGAAARVAPAWRPGDALVLAYVTPAGRVVVRGAWRSKRLYPGALALAWSRDGRRLALATQAAVVVFDGATGRAGTLPLGGVSALAYGRGGRLAVIRDRAVLELGPEGARTLFTAPGPLRGLAWSPDGRWLVTGLPGADQWIFVGGRRVVAVSNIARQFGGVPSLDGWLRGP